jgi:hypothetical protein
MKTEESVRALKVIQEAGMDQSTAIRWAMVLAANILEHAWQHGHEERGTLPDMRVQFKKPARSA